MLTPAWWAGGVIALGAAVTDARSHTISPKWLAVGAAGAVGAWLGGWLPGLDLVWALLIAGAYTLLTAPIPKSFGGGDLKLVAVTAAWWGPAALLAFAAAHLFHLIGTSAWWAARERRTGVRWGSHGYPWAPFLFASWVAWSLLLWQVPRL